MSCYCSVWKYKKYKLKMKVKYECDVNKINFKNQGKNGGYGNTSDTGDRQRCRTLQLSNKLCHQQFYLLIL